MALNLPSSFNFQMPSLEVGIFQLIVIELIIFMLVLLVFVLWFIFRVVAYNYKVYIIEKTSGRGSTILEDRGKLKREPNGQIFLQLKKYKKAPLPALDSEHFTNSRNMFCRGAMVFAKVNELTYIPQQIHDTWENSPFLTPEKFMDIEDFNSAIQDQILIRNKNKKENMVLYILPWVVLFILLIGVGLIFKYGIDKVVLVGPAMDAAAGKFSQSVDKVIPYLEQIAAK